jgi:hypothetical protein
MPQVVVYAAADGSLALVRSVDSESIASAVASVPAGVQHYVLSTADLPQNLNHQSAWVLSVAEDGTASVVEDPARVAEIERQEQLAALDDWFHEVTAPGFETEGGWRLGMTQQDAALLTGHFLLAKEAAALNMPIPPVIDNAGVPHDIESVEALTAVMLAYGQHRASISAEYAAKKAAILG